MRAGPQDRDAFRAPAAGTPGPCGGPKLAVAALLAALLAGCSGGLDAGTGGPPRPGDPDVGSGGGPDGGSMTNDAGPPQDDAGALEPVPSFEGAPSDFSSGAGPGRDEGDAGEPLTCYDGEDNNADADGLVDCADPSCQGLRSCCVGDGDCCAPVSSHELDFGACTDDVLSGCGLDLLPFGDPLARLEGGSLAPGGDAEFDSGVYFDAPVDSTVHRTEISAVFRGAADCDATCLESAGVALSEQIGFDESTHVRPIVGLLLSGSRDQVALFVEDQVRARWDFDAEGAGEERWTLVARPTGEISVTRGDEPMALDPDIRFVPRPSLRLVLYGRNRLSGDGVRLSRVEVSTALCDIPGAWSDRAPLGITGAPDVLDSVDAPSVATDGATRWLAFEHQESIAFARRAPEATDFEWVGAAGVEPSEGAAIGDPELLRVEDRWVLFHSVNEAGRVRIVQREASSPEEGFGDPFPAVAPEDPYVALEMPTVVTAIDAQSRPVWVLVARARRDDGIHHLAGYFSLDAGASWHAVGDPALAELTSSDANIGVGARLDELGAPSLVRFNEAWQLYFAARRGTRWSIGLLTSDELLYWRDLGTVLEASGSGFDRLGASSPAVVGSDGGMELYYVGLDGVRATLGRVERAAASGGSFM